MIKTLLKLASICLLFCVFAVQAIPARPSQPTVSITSTAQTMNVSWPAVNKAVRYNVIQIKNGQWSSVKTVTHNSADFAGTPGSVYQYAVNACDNLSECSFDSPYSAPFQLYAEPYTAQFSWVPSPVYVGQPTKFVWDIRNVQSCYGHTIQSGNKSRPPSGETATYIYTESGSAETIWECTDYYGRKYPAGINVYLRAIRNVLPEKAETPYFSPGAGSQYPGTSITIGSSTSGATIYYTTNGATPNTSSSVYSQPLTLNYGMTIKAMAYKAGFSYSDITSATYSLRLPGVPSTVNMNVGTAPTQMNLSWGGVAGATYYMVEQTVNGTPNLSNVGHVTSQSYSGNEGSTYSYKVRACNAAGCAAFSAATSPYTVLTAVATPQITPPNGTYSSAQTVNISVTGGDQIRYTQDGSDVTASSPVYSGPFTVSTSRTVKARAYRSGAYGGQANAAYNMVAPAIPANISMSLGGLQSQMNLSWPAVTGATYYEVQETENGTPSIINVGNTASWADTGAEGNTYSYRVRACNAAGCSAFSNSTPTHTVPVNLAEPSFSLPSGTYTSAQTLNLSVSTSGAIIRYTVDGSTVSGTSTQYTGPISIDTTQTVKARAYKSGYSGPQVTRNYTIDIPDDIGKPQFSVPAGTYSSAQTITLTATPADAVIRYTLDGSSVTASSAQYAAPITVSSSLTLKAKAFKGTSSSAESSAAYIINAAVPDWALRTEPTVTETSIPFSPYLPSAAVVPGVVAGEASVEGGQAGYTIPVKIAPGRAGMQPVVSLSYSSRSGNGIAGMGWSLQASSAISRCGSSFANDGISSAVTLSNNDKLCYNGNRLMLLNGSYGANGAQYAVEMDNMSRIVQSGGDMAGTGTSFIMYEASGRVSQFGGSGNSKVIPGGQGVTQQWLLQSVSDATGQNVMRYLYQYGEQAEVLLSQILYTGTAGTDGAGKVEFIYEDRIDKALNYLAGGRVQQTQRLKRIETSYANTKLREYRLSYGNLSAGSGRTLLRQITECSYRDNIAQCLEPTTFNWSEQHAGYELQQLTYPGYNQYRTITEALPRGDVNGDGSRDWNGSFVDAEGTLLAEHDFELAGCYFDLHRQTYVCNQADFNMDGRTDGVDSSGSHLRLAITTGENETLTVSWINTPISLSNSPTLSLGRDRVEGFADFNGDGWPDMLMYRVNGSAPDYRVYLHSKNPAAPYSGNGIVVHVPVLDGSSAERFTATSVQLMGDLNGDGLADLVVMNSKNRFYSYPQSMPAKVLYNTWNGATLSFDSVSLPFAPTQDQWGYFSYFIDVNGDGLTDWIGWHATYGLQYSLNTGKGFTPPAAVSGDTSWLTSRSYHAVNAIYPAEEQTIHYPKYSGAFRIMDVNNDGKSELLVPGERLIESCIMYGDIEGTSAVTKEFCGDAMYGAVRYNATSHATSPIPAESNDESIYRYNAVHFTVTEDGQLNLTLRPTTLIGSATQNAAVDAYGNGLDNLMFTYGSRFSAGQRFNGSTSPLGNQYGTWINRNLGDSSTGQTMIDALVSVSDAAGKTARWQYLPLSSGQTTVAGLPLYATSHHYVPDNQHFHFASSMYVVSQFSQSNGVDGDNLQRFAYRGAVYNHAGRGFSGFRSVIRQDVSQGVIQHADYLQKAPFTGRLQGLFTFRASEYPGGAFGTIQGWSSAFNYYDAGQDAFDVTGTDNAFEQALQRWTVNSAHKAQSGACSSAIDNTTANEQWQCGVGQHRYLVYPVHSTTIKRDLHTKEQLSVQQTEQSAVDEFGNVLTQTQSTADDYGVYSKTLTQVFDASTGWPDKLTSRTVTSHAVQQRHANDPYSSATSDTGSWVRTTFSNFHSSRQPQQISVSTSDDSRSKTLTTVFNDYGLPLTLTETADVMDTAGNWQSSSRTTTLEYGDTVARADGAFVYRTTNPALHTQVSKTSPATGLMQASIDANNLETQFSYDAFGRITGQQTPGAGEVRIALDEAHYDDNAPQHAVWLQVTQQRGMPEQRVYLDMLGRDIRSAVRGFEGNWINRDKRYDSAGRVEAESQPYMQGSGAAWTRYSGFDELNRPGQKVTHDERLTISYQYNGLSTDINAGGLQMSRTYNSQNQLMETVDAENGITRYSYNSQGLPIVLQDANGMALRASYDALGMKTRVADPNQGTSLYQYNGFGELAQETTGGTRKYYDYDGLGRQVSVRVTKGSVALEQFSYSYDSAKKGLPASESTGGVVRSFGYDAYSRLISNTVQLDGEHFRQGYQYHSQSGQLLAKQYPNGLTLAYEYNDYGYIEWEKNAASGYVYRQHIAQDAFGNITQANLGNGVTEYRNFNSATGWVQSLEGRVGGVAVHQLNYTSYDNFGNLEAYSNGATGVHESYLYDTLHRLESQTTSAAGVSATVSFSYDAVGNLLSKSDYGSQYLYGDALRRAGGYAGPNAVRQVSKLDGSTVNFSYDSEGNLISGDGLIISYNSFKQPTQIARGGSTFSFTYGANLERLKEVRNGLTTYEIDKAYEQSSDGSWKVYLDEVAIISHHSEEGHRIAYSHKDRLGSSITFTDHNGQVTGRRHYDAFGKPRAISGAFMEPAHRPRQINFTDIAGISNAGITRRGFTDHRHLDEAELIHMNGRAYDYNLGRFLSVDPFIQSPTNSQSLNPYSYIMNNPLAGTDPTGYMAKSSAGCFFVANCSPDSGGGRFGKLGFSGGGSSSEDIPDNGADKNTTASEPVGQAITDIGTQRKLSGTGSVGQNTNQEDGGYLSTASGFVKGLAQSFLDSQAQAFAGGIGIQDTDNIQSSIQISTTDSESKGLELAESAVNNAGMLSSTVGMLANLRTADFTPDENIIRGSLSLLVTDGKIDVGMLKTFVPENIRNTFGPTDDIPAGQKYKFRIGDTDVVLKWHSPQGRAKMMFPNSNSGNMWTAQVQVGKKFLTTEGKWVRQAKRDDTHIPVIR